MGWALTLTTPSLVDHRQTSEGTSSTTYINKREGGGGVEGMPWAHGCHGHMGHNVRRRVAEAAYG